MNMVMLACRHLRISGFCLGPPKHTGNTIAKKVLISSLQFEQLMSRRKISFTTCLIKKPANQVASLDLLTASS